MSDHKKKMLREEYISRINKVVDYIGDNLGAQLTLTQLAQVANFSPYHFHRIFSSMVGESLSQYIQRLRLEKAAYSLLANPRKSIIEIAFEYGFTTPSSFARAFKRAFNASASQWRSSSGYSDRKKWIDQSNLGQAIHNHGKDSSDFGFYNTDARKIQDRRNRSMANLSMKVEVKDVPEKHVAYIRHTGPYKGDSALFASLFGKLDKWASARDLIKPPDTQLLTIYHDSPDITDENKLRISVCLTVPEDTAVSGEVGKMTIPGGKYAIGHFEISVDQYGEAWDALFGDWLPESGYQPDDRPCYELYINDPDEHPEKKHLVDIYLGVKPL